MESTKTLANHLDSINRSNVGSEAERCRLLASAQALIARLQTPWETLRTYTTTNSGVAAALKVCLDLQLFTKWRDMTTGSLDIKALAELSKTDGVLLERFLRHLVSVHLLDEPAAGVYSQTQFTLALCEPRYSAWIGYLYDSMIPVFHTLPSFLADTNYNSDTSDFSNNAPFQDALGCRGTNVFDYYGSHLDEFETINNAMAGYTAERASWLDIYPSDQLIDAADDLNTPLLVDVGGGSGSDIESFRKRHPETASRLVLQELPKVISDTIIGTEAGVRAMDHDFFTPQPIHGARAYFLHSILHDWPDDKAGLILDNLRPALTPGYSKLLINENVVPARVSTAHPQITAFDIAMLGMYGGRERTEAGWKALLEKHGFKISKIWTSAEAVESIIEAEVV